MQSPLDSRSKDEDGKKSKKVTTTGLVGVTYDIPRNKWKACFQFNRRERFLGRFDSPEEAASAYDQAIDIVQRLQLEAGKYRKRAKNFPDMFFNDYEVELRVMELIQVNSGSAAATPVQLNSRLSPGQASNAASCSGDCSSGSEQQQGFDAAELGGSPHLSTAPVRGPAAAQVNSPMQSVSASGPTGVSAMLASSTTFTAPNLTAAGSSTATPAGASVWNSYALTSSDEGCSLQIDPPFSSSRDLAGVLAVGAACGAACQQVGFDADSKAASTYLPAAAAAQDNGLELWHRHAPAFEADVVATTAAVAVQQLQSPFALQPASSPFVLQPASSLTHSLAASRVQQWQQQDQATAAATAGSGVQADPRSEDMDALLLTLLEGAQHQEHQEQQGLFYLLEQQQQQQYKQDSSQLDWDLSNRLPREGAVGVKGSASVAAGTIDQQLQTTASGRCHWPQHMLPPHAATWARLHGTKGLSAQPGRHQSGAGAAYRHSLQHEVLRQQQLLQQVLNPSQHSAGIKPASLTAAGSTSTTHAGRCTHARAELLQFVPTSTVAAPPAAAMGDDFQQGQRPNALPQGSWLAALDCSSKALSFAAVCIQAVTELKAQLTMAPAASSSQWLFTFRQQLQGQVVAGAMAVDVSLAACLMMQNLTLLLTEAGAFAASSSSHAAAVAPYAGRSFGVAVCDSLQAALWLLHRELATVPRQGGQVAMLLQHWVAHLRLHASSRADAAVLQLTALV